MSGAAVAPEASVWRMGAVSRREAARFLGVRETKFKELDRDEGFTWKYLGAHRVYAVARLVEYLEGLEAPEQQ